MSRAPLAILALALAALFPVPGSAAGQRVGQLLRLKNGVQANPPGGEIPAPHDILLGTKVSTPKRVTAVIRIDPTPPLRGVVHMGEESRVTFSEQVVDVVTGKVKKLGLFFQLGHFRTAFTSSTGVVARPGDADWVEKTIKTPTAEIRLTGTVIDVQVAPDGTTSVLVLEGSATVSKAEPGGAAPQAKKGDFVLLSDGERTTVRPGQPPTPPSREDPDGDTLGPRNGGGFPIPWPMPPEPPIRPDFQLDLPRLDRP